MQNTTLIEKNPPFFTPISHIQPRLATYGVLDLARRFGLFDRTPDMSVRQVCVYIDKQIDYLGFPKPFAHIHANKPRFTATPQARWARDPVDAWFDNASTPAARIIREEAARVNALDALSDNARRMFGEAA